MSIGELSERTGVVAATIRSWEHRYGVPTPTRRGGGHRRNDGRQMALFVEGARLRRSGPPVRSAFDPATESAVRPARSFDAALREADAGLRSDTLGKPALNAVTAAIEDECMAQSSRPVTIGAFQRARFFRQSEARWRELARTAAQTVVVADFDASGAPAAHLSEVPLPVGSPVRRKWVLVCDAPGATTYVAGLELPAPPRSAARDRCFKTVRTVDPRSVRAATRVGIELVQESDPGLPGGPTASLTERSGSISPELQRVTALFGRIVDCAQGGTDQRSPGS